MKHILLFGFLLFQSCSVSPIKRSETTDQTIYKVNLALVRFFSPEYEPSKINEFEIKERELQCEKPNAFWSKNVSADKVSKMIECLNSIEQGKAHYLYQSSGKIFLKLDPHEKDQPACLKESVTEIPIPREIYFYGIREQMSEQDSFAASFNTSTNRVLDAELRQARVGVEIIFPLSRKLKNRDDLYLWLTTQAFSLLKSDGELQASIVTESTARRCFKDEPLLRDKQKGVLPPVLWP